MATALTPQLSGRVGVTVDIEPGFLFWPPGSALLYTDHLRAPQDSFVVRSSSIHPRRPPSNRPAPAVPPTRSLA